MENIEIYGKESFPYFVDGLDGDSDETEARFTPRGYALMLTHKGMQAARTWMNALPSNPAPATMENLKKLAACAVSGWGIRNTHSQYDVAEMFDGNGAECTQVDVKKIDIDGLTAYLAEHPDKYYSIREMGSWLTAVMTIDHNGISLSLQSPDESAYSDSLVGNAFVGYSEDEANKIIADMKSLIDEGDELAASLFDCYKQYIEWYAEDRQSWPAMDGYDWGWTKLDVEEEIENGDSAI